MNASNIICPSCRQMIRNAVPVGDVYRCGACGANFTAADLASLPPSLAQKTSLVPPPPPSSRSRSTTMVPPPPPPPSRTTTVMPHASPIPNSAATSAPASARSSPQSYFGSVAASSLSGSAPAFSGAPTGTLGAAAAAKSNQPPLGKFPSPASYGLAQAIAWAMVIYSLGSSAWMIHTMLNPPEITMPTASMNPFSLTPAPAQANLSTPDDENTADTRPSPPPPTQPRVTPRTQPSRPSRSSQRYTPLKPNLTPPKSTPPPPPPPKVTPVPAVPTTFTPPQASIWEITKSSLSALQQLQLALLMVCAASLMTRLDRKASWIAWRSEGLVGSLREPPGSSLHFILPLCVAGGVWVYMSLTAGNAIYWGLSIFTQMFNTSALTIIFVAAGVVTFLMGLGCGEVRRFFWRMEQLGKAITKRKRGDELAIGIPQTTLTQPERTSSANYMLGVLVLLAVLYVGSAGYMMYLYQKINSALAMTSMMSPMGMLSTTEVTTEDISRQLWVMAATGFIAIVGGAYTTYRLSLHWSDMLHTWRWAARSIGPAHGDQFGEASTNNFCTVSKLVCSCIMGTLAYLFFRAITVGGFLFFLDLLIPVLLLVCAALCVYFYTKWSSGLKRDSFQYVSATSVFALKEPQTSSLAGWIAFLAWGLIAVMAIQIGMILYDGYTSLSPLMSGMSLDAFVGILCVVSFIIAAALPAIWWALTLRDLNRASENLNACVEVP